MSLLPHIEDGFRAAARDAERDWDGYDGPTRAEAARDEAEAARWPAPDPCEDCCGVCLVCAVRARRRRG